MHGWLIQNELFNEGIPTYKYITVTVFLLKIFGGRVSLNTQPLTLLIWTTTIVTFDIDHLIFVNVCVTPALVNIFKCLIYLTFFVALSFVIRYTSQLSSFIITYFLFSIYLYDSLDFILMDDSSLSYDTHLDCLTSSLIIFYFKTSNH